MTVVTSRVVIDGGREFLSFFLQQVTSMVS
jgi:hypothetical protein